MAYFSTDQKVSHQVLLPNLRYKNENIYYKSKNPIKTKTNDKIKFIDEILLENMSMHSKIKYNDQSFSCNIIKKELDEGLIINIEYTEYHYISNTEIQKIARYIESLILGIDIIDDSSDSEYLSNYNYENELHAKIFENEYDDENDLYDEDEENSNEDVNIDSNIEG